MYTYAVSPAALSGMNNGSEIVQEWVKKACQAAKLKYHETNYLVLRRGPYVVAAGLDESPARRAACPEWALSRPV